MIVDTSAVLAILFDEPDAARFATAIAAASSRVMSAVSLVETTIVLESRSGAAAGHELDAFLQEAESRWHRSPSTGSRRCAGRGEDSARATTRRD